MVSPPTATLRVVRPLSALTQETYHRGWPSPGGTRRIGPIGQLLARARARAAKPLAITRPATCQISLAASGQTHL